LINLLGEHKLHNDFNEVLEKLQKVLIINEDSLDIECKYQASFYDEIARSYSEAISIRDELDEQLTRVEAELSLKIRSDAELTGKKLTEKRIEDEITTHKNRIEALNSYLKAKKIASDLFSTMQSFSQRADMIKLLCNLFISGYFGEITVRGGDKQVEEKKYEIGKRRLRETK
jgi:DNA helicase IV